MDTKTKAETFIGFAVKAGKLRTGTGTIERLKNIKLLIVCGTASDNAKDKAKGLAAKHKCVLLVSKKPLGEIVYKENVKIAAVTDYALAKAISANAGEDFISEF